MSRGTFFILNKNVETIPMVWLTRTDKHWSRRAKQWLSNHEYGWREVTELWFR